MSINKVAVSKNLESFFEDIQEFDQADFKVQGEEISNIIKSDPAKAKRISMGQENAPSGLLPELFLAAMSNQAAIEGDIDTLRELGLTSKLVASGTVMGRRIRAFGELDKGSPIKAMAKVAKVREDVYAKKHKKKSLKTEKSKEAAQIKESIKKAKVKNGAKALSDFISALEC